MKLTTSFSLLCLLFGLCQLANGKRRDREIVKKLKKRFFSSVTKNDAKVQIEAFGKLSEVDVERLQKSHAGMVAYYLRDQSSIDNEKVRSGVWGLTSLMSEDLEVTVCGLPNKLTYVPFINYLKKQRETYEKSEDKAPSYQIIAQPLEDNSEEGIAKARSVLNFLVSFNLTSKSEFHVQQIYNVTMKLQADAKIWNNYTITQIDEIGQCPDVGTYNFQLASIDHYADEDMPEPIRELTGMFDTRRPEFLIPNHFTKHLDPTAESFESVVCHDNTDEAYTKDELITWFTRFQTMWYPLPEDKEHTKVHILNEEEDMIVARVTMRLRIGMDPSGDSTEWNFRVRAKYNVHGDDKWYIDKMDVLCPVAAGRTYKNISGDAIQRVIGDRIDLMIADPKLWYQCTHFLDDFVTQDNIKLGNCNMEQTIDSVTNFDELDHTFWEHNREHKGKILGYNLGELVSDENDPNLLKFIITVLFTSPEANHVTDSEWSFVVKWDEKSQFYSIIEVEFGCPDTRRGYMYYRNMRFNGIGK